MAAVYAQQEAAEAINSALYQTDFIHLGNSEGGRIEWWTRGEKPKNVRVSVTQSKIDSSVIVEIEWANLSGAQLVKGRKNMTFPTDTSVTDESIRQASAAALVMCLEVFKDVLEGKGAAGPEVLENFTFDDSVPDTVE